LLLVTSVNLFDTNRNIYMYSYTATNRPMHNNYDKRSIKYKISSFWNQLPNSIKKIS